LLEEIARNFHSSSSSTAWHSRAGEGRNVCQNTLLYSLLLLKLINCLGNNKHFTRNFEQLHSLFFLKKRAVIFKLTQVAKFFKTFIGMNGN